MQNLYLEYIKNSQNLAIKKKKKTSWKETLHQRKHSSKNEEPTDTKGWLYYVLRGTWAPMDFGFLRGNPGSVLEPIPCWHWGTTYIDNK